MVNPAHATSDDEQHLRLLAIFHYIDAGLTALFACFPLLHLAVGLAMIFWPEVFGGKPSEQPPVLFGWLFACMGAGMFLAAVALAICTFLAGRFIARRQRYWFVFVMAGIHAFSSPSARLSAYLRFWFCHVRT